MTKIIFDVTDLRKYISIHAHLSGIQRVMVMIIDELAAQAGADKIWLGYCGTDAQDYQVRPYSALGAEGMANTTNLAAVLDQPQTLSTRPTLEGYADKPLKRQFHTLIRNIKAQLGNEAHFTRRKTTIDAWRASAPARAAEVDQAKTQNVFEICGPEDWLVMLDAGWADSSWQSSENWCHKLRAKGVRVAVLVHDLIQIQNPEYIPGTNSMVFYKWLHSTLGTADVYLANSKATAHDLQGFITEHKATQPIHVLPLAQHPLTTPPTAKQQAPSADADLPDIPARYSRLSETWDMDDDVRTLLKWPYVLCVGTMDIRKNLWALSHVWLRLSQNKDITLPKLVFAGRKGSFNEDFNRLMQATGQLGGWAEIYHTASDSELDFLYRNCLFTAMPSFYEGWGLPIGESLSYGKTGVVSQTSSMPEVGLDLVEYCDPYDMASMEAACLRLIADPAHRKELEARIAKTKLRSWSDVSHDLLEFLA
jgi:glycosyltransferase involved in cell wall biosynthesis